jgi:hypothetical protein
MKTLNQPAKMIATIVIGLAFSGLAMAVDEMGKDNTGFDRGAGMEKGGGMRNSARSAANSDYKTAVANCKTMERAERRTCMNEAKAARKTAMGNARGNSTSMRSGKSNTSGETATETSKTDGVK